MGILLTGIRLETLESEALGDEGMYDNVSWMYDGKAIMIRSIKSKKSPTTLGFISDARFKQNGLQKIIANQILIHGAKHHSPVSSDS